MRYVFCCMLVGLFCTLAQGQVTLRVCGWNVEGISNNGDVDPALIESQLAAKDGVDIWGLSEVNPNFFDEFERGAAMGEGSPFEVIPGTTGGDIRLAIIFDTSKVDLLGSDELNLPQFSNHRAPLVARFRGKTTGQEFLFMVNHLASGNASSNQAQANALNTWANQQTLPVINVGDFNFRLNLTSGSVRPGLGIMTNGPWHELQPVFRARTQANFNSILDHVFIANRQAAMGWTGVARIINRNGDQVSNTTNFSDTSSESDHRPVDAILTLQTAPPGGSGGGGGGTASLENRVEALEGNMEELANKLERIENAMRDLLEALNE